MKDGDWIGDWSIAPYLIDLSKRARQDRQLQLSSVAIRTCNKYGML